MDLEERKEEAPPRKVSAKYIFLVTI
jgi:hypothetical protein